MWLTPAYRKRSDMVSSLLSTQFCRRNGAERNAELSGARTCPCDERVEHEHRCARLQTQFAPAEAEFHLAHGERAAGIDPLAAERDARGRWRPFDEAGEILLRRAAVRGAMDCQCLP